MNEKLLEQKAEEYSIKENCKNCIGYDNCKNHCKSFYKIKCIYKQVATEETKLLSEHILELQKTNGSLTDKVNELSDECLGEYEETWGYCDDVHNVKYDFVDGEVIIAWCEIPQFNSEE